LEKKVQKIRVKAMKSMEKTITFSDRPTKVIEVEDIDGSISDEDFF